MQFNLSTAYLSIREDEDLPSRLAIFKTGQIEHNISFQVYVFPGEGNPNENGSPNENGKAQRQHLNPIS